MFSSLPITVRIAAQFSSLFAAFACYAHLEAAPIDPKLIPHPYEYSIPSVKIVTEIPVKTQDFAYLNPRNSATYIYREEAAYYADYQRSFYALTCKKAGWDCMRHYEILANGCIPYFLDLDKCDEDTLFLFPKSLIWEAMHLDGVSYMKIDHSRFDKKRYYEILEELLQYTRAHLSSEAMASYLLNTLHYSGQGKILVLSQNAVYEYLRDLTLIGLKGLFQDRVVDVPKIEHIYQSYAQDVSKLYGRGMTYTKVIPDLEIDRSHIEERIRNREFDLVLYAEIHKGALPFYDLVKQYYSENEIAYIYCFEEEIKGSFHPVYLPNLFAREYYLYKRENPEFFPRTPSALK